MLCYTYITCLTYELLAFSTQITLEQRVFKCDTRLKSTSYKECCYYFRRMLSCAPFLNPAINRYLRSCQIEVLFYIHVIQVLNEEKLEEIVSTLKRCASKPLVLLPQKKGKSAS